MRGLVLDATNGMLEDSEGDDYLGALVLTDGFEPVVEIRVWSSLGMWVHVVDARTSRAATRLEVTPAQLEVLYQTAEPERSAVWARIAERYAAA